MIESAHSILTYWKDFLFKFIEFVGKWQTRPEHLWLMKNNYFDYKEKKRKVKKRRAPTGARWDQQLFCRTRKKVWSPAWHSGFKDPALPQLWLGSNPWPGNSVCHRAAKKERKKRRGEERQEKREMSVLNHWEFEECHVTKGRVKRSWGVIYSSIYISSSGRKWRDPRQDMLPWSEWQAAWVCILVQVFKIEHLILNHSEKFPLWTKS